MTRPVSAAQTPERTICNSSPISIDLANWPTMPENVTSAMTPAKPTAYTANTGHQPSDITARQLSRMAAMGPRSLSMTM